ncbi:MAG: hypothetical protein LBQ43_01320, partial [Holosporales bacterium]|nr:hypothetical protein [Holosporales bacterium]
MEDRDKASLPANLTDAMLLCLEYASQHGVNQQLEPINRSETILLNTIEDEDMLAAIRAAASEAARMKAASMELLRELEGLSAQIR